MARSADVRVPELAANHAFGEPRHALATEENPIVEIRVIRDDEKPPCRCRSVLAAGTEDPKKSPPS